MFLPDWEPLSLFIWGVQAGIVVLLVLTTLTGRDLWPFSHYPMFAGAPRGSGSRWFRLQFRFRDGRVMTLTGPALILAEAFSREFEAIWPDASPGNTTANEVARRFWREATGYLPSSANAATLEVVLQWAHIASAGGIAVTEKRVHCVELTVQAS